MKIFEIKKILQENETWAKKNYGQHFLVDERVLGKIVETADIRSSDRILEIGPGLGVLTEKLLEKAYAVVAIEADKFLVEYLKNRFFSNVIASPDVISGRGNLLRYKIASHSAKKLRGTRSSLTLFEPERPQSRWPRNDGNLTIQQFNHREAGSRQGGDNLVLIEGDALKALNDLDFIEKHLSKPYKVVANIPYSITSKFFRLLLENKYSPASITCLIQKEVAERIVAKPGKMSLLSLSVQYFGQPKIIAHVPASAFWPPPKIESAILSISKIKYQKSNIRNDLFRIARMGFSSRRKTLVNNLSAGLRIAKEKAIDIIKSAGLKENVRAQELSVEDWKKLACKLISS